MNKYTITLLSGMLVIFCLSTNAAEVDYEREIKPIFQQHCVKCHGPKKQKSKLRVDLRASLLRGGDSGEPAVQPGKSAGSYLIEVLKEKDEEFRMPPEKPALPAAQIQLIEKWINEGAKMPETGSAKLTTDLWSFQPLKKVSPVKTDDKWVANPIDGFILRKLEENKLSHTYRADRRTLIRRMYLDMLGLLPSPERVEAFVNDKRDDAYGRLVEEVLASKHYGERWAKHWLDVVRFAESNGFEVNTERPNAYHYRDYVIRALNEDKPYNEFIIDQLAGDVTGEGVATGFIVGGAFDAVGSADPLFTEIQRQDQLTDMVNATSTAFLGITVACAKCHNHKFDPITAKDFYSMQAVFAGVFHGDRALDTKPDPAKQAKINAIQKQLNQIQPQISKYQPSVYPGHTVMIDDEDSAFTKMLVPKRGHGNNEAGTGRGQANDPGSATRYPNLSNGRYTYWDKSPGKDVFAYTPEVKGQYHLWVSYGMGHKSHTTEAEYWLDVDGNLETKGDQKRLAYVNQQTFNDGSGNVPGKTLWSGFQYLGAQEYSPESCIVIRSDKAGRAVTADVIVLQEVVEPVNDATPIPVINKVEKAPRPTLMAPVNSKRNIENIRPVKAKHLRFTILRTNASEPCIDELEVYTAEKEVRNIALAKLGTTVKSSGDYPNNPIHKLEHINDGVHGNSRSWISNTNGSGWVEMTFPETVTINRITWGRDFESKFSDRTAIDYRIEVSVDGKNWEMVAGSSRRAPFGLGPARTSAYQSIGLPADAAKKAQALIEKVNDLEQQISVLSVKRTAYAGRFGAPETIHRLYRGDPTAKREVITPEPIEVLHQDVGDYEIKNISSEQERRLALAKWIASEKNPLTARVMVNRLWQHHFGNGIVATPSDFGNMGFKPTHPELLDYLANELIENNWSLKHIHRLILSSNTYQQTSAPCPDCMAVDANTRFLWRYPPRRLEAEAIRDNILVVSGNLDRRMYGPGFLMFHPNANYSRNWVAKDNFGPPEFRRMVYALKLRMENDAVFGAFDCPDAGQVAPKRMQSTTPIQALNLFNSPFTFQQTQALAQRATNDGKTLDQQIDRVYQLCYQRSPSKEELEAAVEFATTHGLESFCRAILNSNEFLFLR